MSRATASQRAARRPFGNTLVVTILLTALFLTVPAAEQLAAFSAAEAEGMYYYTVSSGGPGVIYRFDPEKQTIKEINLAAENGMEIAALGQIDAIDEKLYVREKTTGRILEIRRDGTQVYRTLEERMDEFCAGHFDLYFIRGEGLGEYDFLWEQHVTQITEHADMRNIQSGRKYVYLLARGENGKTMLGWFDMDGNVLNSLVSGEIRDFRYADEMIYFVSGKQGVLEQITPDGYERKVIFAGGVTSAPRIGPEGWLYMKMHGGGLWKMDRQGGMRTKVAGGPVGDWDILGHYLFIERSRSEEPLSVIDLSANRRYIPEDFMRPGGLISPDNADFQLVPGLVYHVIKDSRHFAGAEEVRFRLWRYDGRRKAVTEVLDFIQLSRSTPYRYPRNTYMEGMSERELTEPQLRRAAEAGAVTFEELIRKGAAVRGTEEEESLPVSGSGTGGPLIVREPLGPQELSEAVAPLDRARELSEMLDDSPLRCTLEREFAPEEGRLRFLLELEIDLTRGSDGESETFRPASWRLDFRQNPDSGEIQEFLYTHEVRHLPADSGLPAGTAEAARRKAEELGERMREEVQQDLLRIFHLLYPQDCMEREFRLQNARVIYSMGEAGGMSVESFELAGPEEER
jgi:hypothetical protein